MSFSEEFLFNASKLIEVKSIESDFGHILRLVKKATDKFITKTPVETYIHGSYANNTNIFFPSNLEVCVELKLPRFEYAIAGDYFINHELEYGPKEFRQDLFDTLSEIIENDVKLECLMNDKSITIPRHGPMKHSVEITPCVSFTLVEDNGAEFKGVLVHNGKTGTNIATFPKLHKRNGEAKDIRCEGNFKRFVRLFKTLKAIAVRENKEDEMLNRAARGYFIECLLYNVPDNLFRGKTLNETFLKIINYLAHANLYYCVCQNDVWHLFGKATEFWNEKAAGDFIKSTKVFCREFPTTRANLA